MVSFEAKRKVNTLGVTRVIHKEISGLVRKRRRRRKQDGTERKSVQRVPALLGKQEVESDVESMIFDCPLC